MGQKLPFYVFLQKKSHMGPQSLREISRSHFCRPLSMLMQIRLKHHDSRREFWIILDIHFFFMQLFTLIHTYV